MNDSVKAVPACCPYCADSAIVYKRKAALWDCQSCEKQFQGSAPEVGKRRLDDRAARPKAIFFSYGHDENKELVMLFKNDLEKRGHQVWFDEKDIGSWDDWKGKITRGIDASELAIAFISKHSIRDPGVCRNEIAIAMNRFGEVYPILLEAGIEQDIPITIRHLQWPDLSQWKGIREGKLPDADWDRWYEEKLLNLIEKIEGDATRFADETRVLIEVLQPASFATKITQHVPGFIGREWLFEAYHQWVDHQPESRLFWIKAGPGVGKSAIAANLAHRERAAIAASWFCDAKSSVLKDPNSALKSIAFQLALRWEDYRVKLLRKLELYASATNDTCEEVRKELAKKTTQDLFLFLLAEPMAGLIWREHKLVVVIDALDEATDEQGNNRITELISTELSSLPEWIGFVVTSRPEAEVVNRLGGFKPFAIDAEDPRNVADLRSWYKAHLGRRPELSALPEDEQLRIEDQLIERSSGMILYLKVAEEGLKEGSLEVSGLEQLQAGLPGLYRRYYDSFQQRFGSDYEESVKPLLRLLLAAGGPLPEDLTCEVLGWNSEQFLVCRNKIGSYAIETTDGYELFHKTLGEWLIDKSSGTFHLDRALGRQMLADVLFKEVADEGSHLVRWRKPIQEWLPSWLPQLAQYQDPSLLCRLVDIFGWKNNSIPREIIEHAVNIQEKALGPEHMDTLETLDTLAVVHERDRDLAASEKLFRHTLSIREKTLGTEHPEVVRSLQNLARTIRKSGKHKELESIYRRILMIQEKNLGFQDSMTARSLRSLIRLLEANGDICASWMVLREQLERLEQSRGIDQEETIRSMQNLAVSLRDSGRLEEAEQLQRESMARHVRVHGEDSLEAATTYSAMGALLKLKGELTEAETQYRKALVIRERDLGPDDEKTLLIRQRLEDLNKAGLV